MNMNYSIQYNDQPQTTITLGTSTVNPNSNPSSNHPAASSWDTASFLSAAVSEIRVQGKEPKIATDTLPDQHGIRQAISNIKAFFALFDGSDYDNDKFTAAFEKTFDQKATASVYPMGTPLSDLANPSKRVELDYNGLLEQVCRGYAMTKQPVKILSIRHLFKGMIEYTLQGKYQGGYEAMITSHAYAQRGQIVRVERVHTALRSTTTASNNSKNNFSKARIRHGSQLIPESPLTTQKSKIRHSAQILPEGPDFVQVHRSHVRHGSQLLPQGMQQFWVSTE